MRRLKMHKKTLIHLSALLFFVTDPLMAQTINAWPNRPIRMVVLVLTGGPDTLMRVLNPYLSSALGQAIIVDNKSGANGIIGTDSVVKSTPDGYTFLVD
jgi:tripartite-type tricarboxylate transporter receptor subunit TctC